MSKFLLFSLPVKFKIKKEKKIAFPQTLDNFPFPPYFTMPLICVAWSVIDRYSKKYRHKKCLNIASIYNGKLTLATPHISNKVCRIINYTSTHFLLNLIHLYTYNTLNTRGMTLMYFPIKMIKK